MATGINYLDETWNMILGCTHASIGCVNCWAEAVSHVHASHPNKKISEPYQGVTKGGKWTGKVKCLESRLEIPLHWRKPRRIGVSFMADLFHDNVPFDFIDKVFGIMSLCPQHTFLILSKRPKRLLKWCQILPENAVSQFKGALAISDKFTFFDERLKKGFNQWDWPLPNVMLGVSVEDQETADERIPLLLQTPAAKRFVSFEPALEHIGISQYLDGIDLVIMGGESGPGYRPMDVRSARAIRNQCLSRNTAFFFKQMAGKKPIPEDLQIREWPA